MGIWPKILAVTSPNVGDGKTTVTANLAIALAETGQRVLLIDADMRRPRIHSLFGLDNRKGLTSLLQNGFQGQQQAPSTDTETLCQPTVVPGLFVLTAGPSVSGPTNLLYAKHLPGYLRKYTESFDMILLDTPPMMTIPDARLIGRMASAILLVVRAKKTTRDAAVAARMRLKEDGSRGRFQLCSWAGLTPKHHESDTVVRRGSITKQGSRLVRWAAVEAVTQARGTSKLQVDRRHLAERRGTGIAKVAAARKLLTLVYYGLRDGEIRCLARAKAAA